MPAPPRALRPALPLLLGAALWSAGCAGTPDAAAPSRVHERVERLRAEQQEAAYDSSGAAASALLPYGDGRGGFAWLDGTPVRADSGRYGEGSTLAIDLPYFVGLALDSADDVRAWSAVAERVAQRVQRGRPPVPGTTLRQAIDRELVAHALASDAPAAAVAFAALERLAEHGSPDAVLALHALPRLLGHVPAARLGRVNGRLAAATRAWLRQPFASTDTEALVRRLAPRIVAAGMAASGPAPPDVALVLARRDRDADAARLAERRRMWAAARALDGRGV